MHANAAIRSGVSVSPSTVTAISICTVGDRNWMKLTASSGNRRSDSVNVSSGTTVTMPLNAMQRVQAASRPRMWFSPVADR